MAETKYSYTISTQTENGKVYSVKLEKEILESSITTGINYINTDEDLDSLDIFMEDVLSNEDETTLDAVVLAHNGSSAIGSENYYIQEYSSNNRLEKRVWYNTDNGDGTYSGKVHEILYYYNGAKLEYSIDSTFMLDGTILTSQRYDYYEQNNPKKHIEKKV